MVSKRERATGAEVFRQGISHGRSGPRLYPSTEAGVRRDLAGSLKAWGWLVLRVPWLLDRGHRKPWLRVAGVRIGRLVGSVENRVFFP